MKWTFDSEEVQPGICRYRLSEAGRLLDNSEFTSLLSTSDDFILFFNNLLRDSPFDGYFWEVKPVDENCINHTFEFVLVRSSRIALRKADPRPFMEYIQNAHLAVAFPNLGKNAQLIAPAMSGKPGRYAHVAGFVRYAPREQILAFWKLVGREFQKSIGAPKKWLSTAGFGVSWLHVRIDTRPKYYRYKPYKLID